MHSHDNLTHHLQTVRDAKGVFVQMCRTCGEPDVSTSELCPAAHLSAYGVLPGTACTQEG